MLIDVDVVGNNCENIDFKHRLAFNEEGDRVFSDFGTGDLFKHICEHVRDVEGELVVPLCLGINMDKTTMSRLCDISAWPCNVAIMNLKTSILSTRKGSRLVGYCPIMNISDRSLAPPLLEAGISKAKHVDAVRLIKKILEQDYLQAVIDPVIQLEKFPPIALQYGRDETNLHWTRIKIVLYMCK